MRQLQQMRRNWNCAEQYANVNLSHKDKLGYWHKKFRNMRKAKAMRPLTQRQKELREEEAWRLGAEAVKYEI